jgi:hypothetical protein
MNQKSLRCGLKEEHAHALPLTAEALLMRLSVASLRWMVKGDTPMRSTRPILCSTRIGFHGMSKLIRTPQVWRFKPA